MASLFNMIATGSHSDSMKDDVMNKANGLWDQFVDQEPSVWSAFHQYWLDNPKNTFVHIIRYEDLLFSPREALRDLTKFIIESESIENTFASALIDNLTQYIDISKHQVYKPR
jgi:hypothetical protein